MKHRGVSTPKIGKSAEPPNRVGPDGPFEIGPAILSAMTTDLFTNFK